MPWCCRDKKLEYGKKTLIMGIVNVTPDSFSDGGKYFNADDAVNHALQLIEQGADIIDIGAQSTRPNYEEITKEQEWQRIKPVLKKLREKTDLPISVDTYFPYVAENALNLGADIINDISGAVHIKMAEIVKKRGCGWVIMHNGSADIAEMRHFFIKSAEKCESLGVDKAQLCFDMGIGFGKSYEQNLSLIANIGEYKLKGYPLLLGASRKRVIGEGSRQPNVEKRIFGNIAADTAAILGGADIIRLHDVESEKQGIYMADELKKLVNYNG